MTLDEALRKIPYEQGYRAVFGISQGRLNFKLMKRDERGNGPHEVAGVDCTEDLDVFVALVSREICSRFDPNYDECEWEPVPSRMSSVDPSSIKKDEGLGENLAWDVKLKSDK